MFTHISFLRCCNSLMHYRYMTLCLPFHVIYLWIRETSPIHWFFKQVPGIPVVKFGFGLDLFKNGAHVFSYIFLFLNHFSLYWARPITCAIVYLERCMVKLPTLALSPSKIWEKALFTSTLYPWNLVRNLNYPAPWRTIKLLECSFVVSNFESFILTSIYKLCINLMKNFQLWNFEFWKSYRTAFQKTKRKKEKLVWKCFTNINNFEIASWFGLSYRSKIHRS